LNFILENKKIIYSHALKKQGLFLDDRLKNYNKLSCEEYLVGRKGLVFVHKRKRMLPHLEMIWWPNEGRDRIINL